MSNSNQWRVEERASLLDILFRHSLDAILVCANEGDIFLASPSASALFGFSNSEITQMNIREFDGTGNEEKSSEMCPSSLVSKGHRTIEPILTGRDGMSFPASVYIHPMHFSGRECCLLIIRDISKLREQELELRQSSKMQAIGQLAGGIAHDFNNALGGIVGYAELAIDDAGDNLIQKENIEKLLQAADRAKKLVKQILTFSRQNTPKRDAIALATLMNQTIAFLRSSIPATVNIETDISGNELSIAGDASKIQEMLFNLATNAVAAMGEDGVLRIALMHEDFESPFGGVVGKTPAGSYAVIHVADSGCGIEPSIMHLVFEPFFSTRHSDEGTGMGLSVVFGVVRSHGGNIRIDSIPGEGTTVQVYLPTIPMKTINAPAPYTRSERGNETLLVIDDEPLLVDICGKLLKSLGYKVVSTMDVNEALDILQDKTIHLDALLTDQTMPQMKGVDLASRAVRLRPGLPVILCSGFSRSVDEETALNSGIARFIQKPVRKKELAVAVRDVLDRSSLSKSDLFFEKTK